jgi:hypothetical protein
MWHHILDLLNLRERGGLKIFALELGYFERWYFPYGFLPIYSELSYVHGAGTIKAVVFGKTE